MWHLIPSKINLFFHMGITTADTGYPPTFQRLMILWICFYSSEGSMESGGFPAAGELAPDYPKNLLGAPAWLQWGCQAQACIGSWKNIPKYDGSVFLLPNYSQACVDMEPILRKYKNRKTGWSLKVSGKNVGETREGSQKEGKRDPKFLKRHF